MKKVILLGTIFISMFLQLEALDNYTLAFRAIEDNSLNDIKKILPKLFNPGYQRRGSLLMVASEYGNVEVIQEIINALHHSRLKIEKVNAQDAFGNTALIYAINSEIISLEDKINVIQVLLKSGIDPNIKNHDGKNVFDIIDKMKPMQKVKIQKVLKPYEDKGYFNQMYDYMVENFEGLQ